MKNHIVFLFSVILILETLKAYMKKVSISCAIIHEIRKI